MFPLYGQRSVGRELDVILRSATAHCTELEHANQADYVLHPNRLNKLFRRLFFYVVDFRLASIKVLPAVHKSLKDSVGMTCAVCSAMNVDSAYWFAMYNVRFEDTTEPV